MPCLGALGDVLFVVAPDSASSVDCTGWRQRPAPAGGQQRVYSADDDEGRRRKIGEQRLQVRALEHDRLHRLVHPVPWRVSKCHGDYAVLFRMGLRNTCAEKGFHPVIAVKSVR